MKLSKHFSDYEFKCHCGKCELVLPPKELIDVLEDIREYFGRPVTIMSGYRCKNHNNSVGGAKRSKHLKAIAADIIISGISPNEVQKYLLKKYPRKYGIGRYSYFTHVDVRSKKGRW